MGPVSVMTVRIRDGEDTIPVTVTTLKAEAWMAGLHPP
jgi:hypothetical protein